MEILFGIMIFIMGTVFGSFFTLAVYRIPLRLDITHERSFCPKCGHRLEFLDLIPVLSYIFLGGKCRYCKEPVRPRYLILEILSGFVFLLAYLSFNMNFPFFKVNKIIDFIAFIAFYITMVLILGIDKEYRNVEKHVLLFGVITQFVYIIYLYASKSVDLYRYAMYLGIMIILVIIDTIFLKKKSKSIYAIQILMLITYILMCVSYEVFILIMILSILYILIYKVYRKVKFNLKDKADILEEQVSLKIPYAFCIGISSILIVIVNNFMVNFL